MNAKWWWVVPLLAVGCGPTQRPRIGTFDAQSTMSTLEAAPLAGFADEAGDALLLQPSGSPVRVRLDGSQGPLESHPGNPEPPGAVRGLWPLGPHSALVAAANGLYIAQAGWLIAPPWRVLLSPEGVVGAADTADGTAWIAHESGLFRLKDGQLAELKISGASVAGLKAVVAGRAEDGQAAVWFASQAGLSMVTPSGMGGYSVRRASLAVNGASIRVLASVGDGMTTPGEVWVLSTDGLYRNADDGWHGYDLGGVPDGLSAAGRTVWALVKHKLLRFDVDENEWEQAQGLDGEPTALLAADTAGAAWVQLNGVAAQVARGRLPRLRGFDQNERVSDGDFVIQAVPPPGPVPSSVRFAVDNGDEVTVAPPLYSFGGADTEGRPRSYSLVGLSEGMHALALRLGYGDGTTAERTVPFAFKPVSLEILSWDKDIRPIFEARCAACHVSGPGPELVGYEKWKANAETIVYMLRERRMPADGPLEPELILRVQRWAQMGTPP